MVATTTAPANKIAKRIRSTIGNRWIVERNGISLTSVDVFGLRNDAAMSRRDGEDNVVANVEAEWSNCATALRHESSRIVVATSRSAWGTANSTTSPLLAKYEASSPT
jgi:hypothetical protein